MKYQLLQSDTFRKWLRGLDKQAKSRIAVRLDRAEDGNFGDHQSVGKGVSEMRLSFGNAYRIYYTIRGLTVVILLCGGTKSSQKRDIERAQQMAEELP